MQPLWCGYSAMVIVAFFSQKVGDVVFREQRLAENTQYLIHTSIEGQEFLDERNVQCVLMAT